MTPEDQLAAIREEIAEVTDAWKRTIAFLLGAVKIDLGESYPLPKYLLALNSAIARLDAVSLEVGTGKVADVPPK